MRPIIVLAIFALATSVLPAQEESKNKSPTVIEAVEAGAKILVAVQERYQRDSRMRRVRDDQLKEWQDKEHKRLADLRKSNAPGEEWPYEGVYRVGGIVPPGYRVGGTAIACYALVHAPGFAASANQKAAVARGMKFMLQELKTNELLGPGPKVRYDVRGWAHAYALDFFLLAERRELIAKDESKGVRDIVRHLIKCLVANETSGGGWNYAGDSLSPFMTGSTLIALYHARAQGYDVDPALVERALAGLEKARAKTGSYVYSGVVRTGGRQRGGNRTAMPGACARATIAELTLYLAGRSDQQKLRVAVDAFFEHWGELLKRKSKQGTHMGPYGIAPYYFMYGHTYAAIAIEALPEKDRPALRLKMQETLWRTRESDGGWNDRIFPRSKSYSTAMAMLALLAPTLEPVPKWTSSNRPGPQEKKGN